MSEITSSTTAVELVATFGFSSLEQMGAYLKRYKSKTSSSDPVVQETAQDNQEAVIPSTPEENEEKSEIVVAEKPKARVRKKK